MIIIDKIKTKSSSKKAIFGLLFIIIFIFLYFFVICNTDFNDFLIYSVNYKINNNNDNITTKIAYNSLNKIIDFNDIVITKVSNVIKETNINNISSNPIVYIYNTHDTEKYDLPFISDYSITPDVKLASYILKDHLNDLNIESYVENRKISDYLNKYKLSYTGSYEASRYYMKDSMKKNNYIMFIDIHRDSTKYKYTLYKNNNKKYAKVLFVLAKKNKNYKKNEKFINYLNNEINKNYKGLSRGIMSRDDVIFNQDISPYAILLELGGIDNTLEEINNTLYIIANIIYKYINEENI